MPNHKPNPLPLTKAVMPEHIESTKQLYCKHYDQCLTKTAKLDCIQWTCSGCPAFELMTKQQWKDDIARFVELAATVVDSAQFNIADNDKDIDAAETEPIQPTISHEHKSLPIIAQNLTREERLAAALDMVKQGWPAKQAAEHTETASTTIRRACKKIGIRFSLGKPSGKETQPRSKTAIAIEMIERGHSVKEAAIATKTGMKTIINALEHYKSLLDNNLYGL